MARAVLEPTSSWKSWLATPAEPCERMCVAPPKALPPLEKRVRAVQKKLRSIAELRESIASGKEPTPEQEAKLLAEAALKVELQLSLIHI